MEGCVAGLLDHGLILSLIISELLLFAYWILISKAIVRTWKQLQIAMGQVQDWTPILDARRLAMIEESKGGNGRDQLVKRLGLLPQLSGGRDSAYGQLIWTLALDGWQRGWVSDAQAEEMVFAPADSLLSRARNIGSLFIIVGVAGTLIGLASLVPRIFEVMASQNLRPQEVGGLKTILSYSLMPSIFGVIFTFGTVFYLELIKARWEVPIRKAFLRHYFDTLKPLLVSQSHEMDTLRALAERNMEAVGESMSQAARVLDKVDEFERAVQRTDKHVTTLDTQAELWSKKTALQREVVDKLAVLVERDFASFPERFTQVLAAMQLQGEQLTQQANRMGQVAVALQGWMEQHQQGIQAQTRFVDLARDSVQQMDQHFTEALGRNQTAMEALDQSVQQGFNQLTELMRDRIMTSFSSIRTTIEEEAGKAQDRVNRGANSIEKGTNVLLELGDRLEGVLVRQNGMTEHLGSTLEGLTGTSTAGIQDQLRQLDKEMANRLKSMSELVVQVEGELTAQRSWGRRLVLWVRRKVGRRA